MIGQLLLTMRSQQQVGLHVPEQQILNRNHKSQPKAQDKPSTKQPVPQSKKNAKVLGHKMQNNDARRIIYFLASLALYQLCKDVCVTLGIRGARKLRAIQALINYPDLVHCISLSTGLRGQKPLCFCLTEKCHKILGLPVPKELHIGKGSLEHRTLQHLVARARKIPGTKVEFNANGKNLDVGYVENGRLHAIEIQCSMTHFCENIRKDLAAGVAMVTTLFTSARLLKKAKAEWKNLSSDIQAQVDLDIVGNWL